MHAVDRVSAIEQRHHSSGDEPAPRRGIRKRFARSGIDDRFACQLPGRRADLKVRVRCGGNTALPVDCDGEAETVRIVGVLADEIDSSRSAN